MPELMFDQDVVEQTNKLVRLCRERGLEISQLKLLIGKLWGDHCAEKRKKYLMRDSVRCK